MAPDCADRSVYAVPYQCRLHGSYGMGARTYSDALYDIGSSLSRDGFRNLAFVNLSISPEALKAVAVAVEDLNTLENSELSTDASDFRTTSASMLPCATSASNRPANCMPTSKNQRPDALPRTLRDKIAAFSLLRNPAWEVLKGNFSFQEMGSRDGYLGSPALATPELGKLFIDEAAFALAESIKFAADGNPMPELPIQIRMLLKMVDLDEM